ncbi:MAG: hypothetical protein ACO3JL_06430, partial [Myxococcota bacterium]
APMDRPPVPQTPRTRPSEGATAPPEGLPTRQPPPRAGEGSPVQRRPENAVATSALDRLALELEELLRELSFGWRALRAPDRITVGCALAMVVGVLLPWISDPAHASQPGLQAGGTLHFAIGVLSLWVVARSHGMRGLRMSRRDEAARHRRYSLWLVLLGAASTLAGAYLLLMNGLHRGPEWPVQVHFGLYWTLVAGTGLSYGGYARFADAPR